MGRDLRLGKGLGFVINEIHAFVIVHDDGDEALPAFSLPNGMMMPLVAADPKRLEELRPVAKELARLAQKPMKLVRFTLREDIEVIEP